MTKQATRVAWLVWMVVLTVVFGRVAAYNLGNYRPLSNDEGELMAVAYKLATRGVLGSDMYAGFFGADQHVLINPPLQFVLEALSFQLFGAGVAQARWVSLVAGVSIVWSVSWLALRWYGLAAAMVCGLLLVAWPSNLTGAANGLPLLGVTRVARYDVLAVAFAWLAIVLLDVLLRGPKSIVGLGVGLCCGLAALAQFVGAFALPVVVVNWLWARGRRGFAEPGLYWIVAGASLVWLPWLTFVARYRPDMAAQFAVYGSTRWDIFNPAFYVLNSLNEAARYQNVLRVPGPNSLDPSAPDSPGSQLLLAIAVWPAVVYVAWRSHQTHAGGDRLLWSSLVIFSAFLLLLDQTKTPLYAIILLPSVCLALASAGTALWRWAGSGGSKPWLAVAPRIGLACLGLVVATDAVRAYGTYLGQAAQVSHYLGVGMQLEEALPPHAQVLGPERWWWALHDHPYTSLRSIWFQWSAQAAATDPAGAPQFAAWVVANQADSIVVNDNIHDDLRAFPEPLQQQFWAFIDACTTVALDLNDPAYLKIEVDRIISPPPELEICGGRL